MEFLMMGKYSAHVWSSFAMTAVVIGICMLQARRRHRKVIQDIETRLRAMESDP